MRIFFYKLVIMALLFGANGAVCAKSKSIPPKGRSESDRLIFKGADADMTAPGMVVVKDGKKDIHFQLVQIFDEGDELIDATMNVDSQGKQGGWTTNLSGPDFWVLAIEANGEPLNTGKANTLGKLNGTKTLDFYAPIEGFPALAKGAVYKLVITIKKQDGSEKRVEKKYTK